MQRTEKFGQNMMRGKEKEKRGKEEGEEERKKMRKGSPTGLGPEYALSL